MPRPPSTFERPPKPAAPTDDLPPLPKPLQALVIGLMVVALGASVWVMIAEPGPVADFHVWQMRLLDGSYYPILTLLGAFLVFLLPILGLSFGLRFAANLLTRR